MIHCHGVKCGLHCGHYRDPSPELGGGKVSDHFPSDSDCCGMAFTLQLNSLVPSSPKWGAVVHTDSQSVLSECWEEASVLIVLPLRGGGRPGLPHGASQPWASSHWCWLLSITICLTLSTDASSLPLSGSEPFSVDQSHVPVCLILFKFESVHVLPCNELNNRRSPSLHNAP